MCEKISFRKVEKELDTEDAKIKLNTTSTTSLTLSTDESSGQLMPLFTERFYKEKKNFDEGIIDFVMCSYMNIIQKKKPKEETTAEVYKTDIALIIGRLFEESEDPWSFYIPPIGCRYSLYTVSLLSGFNRLFIFLHANIHKLFKDGKSLEYFKQPIVVDLFFNCSSSSEYAVTCFPTDKSSNNSIKVYQGEFDNIFDIALMLKNEEIIKFCLCYYCFNLSQQQTELFPLMPTEGDENWKIRSVGVLYTFELIYYQYVFQPGEETMEEYVGKYIFSELCTITNSIVDRLIETLLNTTLSIHNMMQYILTTDMDFANSLLLKQELNIPENLKQADGLTCTTKMMLFDSLFPKSEVKKLFTQSHDQVPFLIKCMSNLHLSADKTIIAADKTILFLMDILEGFLTVKKLNIKSLHLGNLLEISFDIANQHLFGRGLKMLQSKFNFPSFVPPIPPLQKWKCYTSLFLNFKLTKIRQPPDANVVALDANAIVDVSQYFPNVPQISVFNKRDSSSLSWWIHSCFDSPILFVRIFNKRDIEKNGYYIRARLDMFEMMLGWSNMHYFPCVTDLRESDFYMFLEKNHNDRLNEIIMKHNEKVDKDLNFMLQPVHDLSRKEPSSMRLSTLMYLHSPIWYICHRDMNKNMFLTCIGHDEELLTHVSNPSKHFVYMAFREMLSTKYLPASMKQDSLLMKLMSAAKEDKIIINNLDEDFTYKDDGRLTLPSYEMTTGQENKLVKDYKAKLRKQQAKLQKEQKKKNNSKFIKVLLPMNENIEEFYYDMERNFVQNVSDKKIYEIKSTPSSSTLTTNMATASTLTTNMATASTLTTNMANASTLTAMTPTPLKEYRRKGEKIEKWWKRSSGWIQKFYQINETAKVFEKLISFFSNELSKKEQLVLRKEFNESFGNLFDDKSTEYRQKKKQRNTITIFDLDFRIIDYHIKYCFTKKQSDYQDPEIQNLLTQYSNYRYDEDFKKSEISFDQDNEKQIDPVIEHCSPEEEEVVVVEQEFKVIPSKPLNKKSEIDHQLASDFNNSFYVDDDLQAPIEGKVPVKKNRRTDKKVILMINEQQHHDEQKNMKNKKEKKKQKKLPEIGNNTEFPNLVGEGELPFNVDQKRVREDLRIQTIPHEDEFPVNETNN